MHRSIRAFNKMERVGDTEEEEDDDEVEVVGIVSDLKINDDSTPCKDLCRRSMLAASRGSTSFRLKDITRGVMSLTQRSSTSSSTCSSFQSLSDSDDEDSFCEASSLNDMFNLAEENPINDDDMPLGGKILEKDEAAAVIVTEYGGTPIAQFHCRQLEVLCSD